MTDSASDPLWRGVALTAGPALAVVVYLLLPSSYPTEEGHFLPLSHAARATAALATWMALWWMTEAQSIYATALLPLLVLPLCRASELEQAAAPYAHRFVFLFMGGFMVALAMERWGLLRRIAFASLRLVGSRPSRLLAAFMAVTALLSMWVSNTATAVIMTSLATSLLGTKPAVQGPDAAEPAQADNVAPCLLLGIAYAASIGGTGTLIGTPPNIFLASFCANELNREISFVGWFRVGLPMVGLLLPCCWLLLLRLFPLPSRIGEIERVLAVESAALGPMSRQERATLAVFLAMALAWLTRPLLVKLTIAGRTPMAGLSDPLIGVGAALLLFAWPSNLRRREFLLDWQTAVRLPWGVLLLFGGGLSLARAIERTGVSRFLAFSVRGLGGLPHWLFALGVTAMVTFLTELTSNTATAATLIPVFSATARGLAMSPERLAVSTSLAASCAFMLPVATPPNAIVFGSGQLSVQQMMRAGVWLNVTAIVVITLLVGIVH